MYYRSIGALQQILLSRPTRNGNNDGKVSNMDKSSTFCSISNSPNNILYMGNGEEYYHLELVCNDDTEYGIQAYGEEAKALYREVKECDLSTHVAEVQRPPELDIDKKEDQEKRNLLKREIDYITSFSFDDKNGYYLVFKKFKDVCISRKKKITPDLP
jgi:hypothetical protein